MAAVTLIGSYNYALVALSVLIAMFASYAALDIAGRVTAASGWTRAVWLLGGAGAMGTGIWSMHYIGMLAFTLPVPVAYHWPTVLLSLLAAVLASAVALDVVSRQKMGASRAVAGSVLIGTGIASMHYIGMAAMRLPAICQFDSALVVMSVVFAILISFAALWITFHFRDEKKGIGWEKLAGAVVMGVAIPVMHYTGMAAASFIPSGAPVNLSHAVSISTLGTAGIVAVTFVVLGLALLTSSVDRRSAAQTLELQEEKLQRSEAYLAEAQKLTHTGSWARRVAGGEALHLSEEWYRIFGFDPENGPPPFEQLLQRIHPEDRAKWKGAIERASDRKSDYEVEFRILLPDATTKHIQTVDHPVLNASGDLLEFVGSSTDITERKRAEQATCLLAAIVESSHDAIVSKTLNGVITSWNKGAERLFGYTAEEAVGQNITLIIPPERRGEERTIIEQLTRGERVDHFETVRVRKDGSLLDVALTISPMKDAAGRIVGASKLARDITERKRAEESLRRSQGYLAEAQRLSHTGRWAWSPATGEMRYCSEECYRLMGFDPHGGQPRFETFYKRIHPDDQPRIAKALEIATREHAEFELDDRIILPGGEIRDVHVVGHPVLGPSGDLAEFVGTMMDVTEHKRAEEERERLRQIQADLAHLSRVTTMGELTASLAHEIRQPIAAAMTNAKTCLRWLGRDEPEVAEAREAASRIVKDVTRAADIISRIGVLFKKGALQRELVDANELIREMIVLLRSEAN